MTRRTRRAIERRLNGLESDVSDAPGDVELTSLQAKAVREYDLYCDSVSDLNPELQEALLEAIDEA